MVRTSIRPDLEGELLLLAEGAVAHYAKRLSLDVAWHVFDVQDVAHVADAVVASVTTDAAERAFYLHYRPAIEPLDWSILRQVLRLNSPGAAWRAARLTLDLCVSLKTLHDEDIPQLVMHPERLGQADGRFVILPTLAGVLSPLPQVCASPVAGSWLHCVAPEVLRTRGLAREFLKAGDVYALGRMLSLLCASAWRPDLPGDVLKLAEQRVERPDLDPWPEPPAGFTELQQLWRRVCVLVPGQRPNLDDWLTEVRSLEARLSPEHEFAGLLERNQLPEAERVWRDLAEAPGVFSLPPSTLHLMANDLFARRLDQGDLASAERGLRELFEARQRLGVPELLLHSMAIDLFARQLAQGELAEAERWWRDLAEARGIFPLPERTLHLMAADLAMSRTPPDCGTAILELNLAESPEFYEADVQHRLARAYAQFTANPQHLQLSCKAYERAAKFGDWKAEVLDEWVSILQQLDPDYVWEVLAGIPAIFHTRKVSILLIECLLRKQEYGEAWREVAALFPGCPFDEGLYQLARRIAQRNETRDLLIWSVTFQEKRGFAAPLAVAWEVLGDEAQAEIYLQEARAYQPGAGG